MVHIKKINQKKKKDVIKKKKSSSLGIIHWGKLQLIIRTLQFCQHRPLSLRLLKQLHHTVGSQLIRNCVNPGIFFFF